MIVPVALMTLSTVVGAQADSAAFNGKTRAELTKYEAVKFAVPESPAFAFLGVSPSKVTRPPGVHDLGTELLNGIGSDGRVKQGIAFELAPYFYFGQDISLKDYQRRGGPRYALANTHISFGTVRTQGDSGSTDFALGLRTVFIDAADPMRNPAVTKALGGGYTACFKDVTGPDEAEKQEGCITKATREAAKKVDSLWNARRMALAVVAGGRLPVSEFRGTHGTGVRAWLGYSERMGPKGQLILSGGYRRNRAETADSNYRALSLGARINFGSAHANLFLEGATEQRSSIGAAVDKTTTGFTGGIEFRAADGVWVSTGVGNGYEGVKKADRMLVLLGLRWGVSAAQRFDPMKP